MIESWTRVISMQRDDLTLEHKFPLNTDLIMSQNLPRDLERRDEQGWQPFFMPKDFVRVNLGINTENFALAEETLLEKGREVT